MAATKYVRLTLRTDASISFLLPTLGISTYQSLSEKIYAIFSLDETDFAGFNVSWEDTPVLRHLWDLGIYFAETREDALAVFVQFLDKAGSVEDEEEEEQEGEEVVVEDVKEEEVDENEVNEERRAGTALALLALNQRQQQPQHRYQHSVPGKRARSSSSNSRPPIMTTAALDTKRTRRWPLLFYSSSSSSSSAQLPPPNSPTTITLHLTFANHMTKTPHLKLPDPFVRSNLPATALLASYENDIKTHASGAFLTQRGRLTQRQRLALGEALAVRVVMEGLEGPGDALAERKSRLGSYADAEGVVRGTVEMWREEDIAMEVLGRESPTGGNAAGDERSEDGV